ncbi:MAG: SNF2-related protein, partial [Psychroflexus sp.]
RYFDLDNYHESLSVFKKALKNLKDDYQVFEKHAFSSLVKRNLKPVTVSDQNPELFFKFLEKEKIYTLEALLKIDGKNYKLASKKIDINPYFCRKDNTIYLFKNPITYLYLEGFLDKSVLNFIKNDELKIYQNFIEPLSQHFEVKNKVFKKTPKAEIKNESLKKQVYLKDFEGSQIIFKPAVQYPETLILLQSKELRLDKKTEKISPRHVDFENRFLEDFQELHSKFQNQQPPFALEPDDLLEDEWFLHFSEKMKSQDVEIFGANDLKSFKYNLNKASVSMSVNSNTDWFDLDVSIHYGQQKVSLKEVRKAMINKQNYVKLNDGSYGILPQKWLDKFSKYFKAGEVKNDQIKLSNYQFNIIDQLYEDLEDKPDFLIELQKKKERLKNLKTDVKVVPPKNINATLRPYQLEGLKWLAFLDENQLGGCLADDMGLGKTLQTIAFISYLKTQAKNKSPHLVIAPTSLIFNWTKEIEKFCPSLKSLNYTGSERVNSQKDFDKHDIVLTTYGIMLRDIDFLKKNTFHYIILDESQAIKNPTSKRYKAACLLKSKNRLALTGTPIENNTFDLYAQMNFLNPGLLGNMSHFKKEFSEAIDKDKNKETAQLLNQMIHPFLLRRTKEKVATELPEKSENIMYCNMDKSQRQVYESFKEKYRDYLLNKIEEQGAEKSQMYVLEGLTKLRQICNSPELLSDDEDYGKSSVKLDLLIEQIKNKTSKHKIVVFSQFTKMLALVKKRLDIEQLDYEYLDGKTKNREERVEHFQNNDDIRIFLISLKAGGTGLNLTAADYVFLVDPWWNPAVESQAIDRCYRIGQKKHVMAYRMICKDTIEEKIIQLQDTKKEISHNIITTDSNKKSFDKSQIKALFS